MNTNRKVYKDRTNRQNIYLWQCGHCYRKFTRKLSLMYHLNSYHPDEKHWMLIKLQNESHYSTQQKAKQDKGSDELARHQINNRETPRQKLSK